MWYFTWILGVLLACAFGIINVLWLEAQEGLDQDAAVLDPLTKLPTRAEFLEALEEKIDQYKNDQTPFSLLLVSLERAKNIVQHSASQSIDQTVVKMTEIIKRETRPPLDIVARYDAETFAIILPGAETSSAQPIARRICENAAGLSETPLASVGVAEFPVHTSCESDDSVQDQIRSILTTTDNALKTAQQKTEQRICCAGELAC